MVPGKGGYLYILLFSFVLGLIFISFVLNSLSHTLTYIPKTKENQN